MGFRSKPIIFGAETEKTRDYFLIQILDEGIQIEFFLDSTEGPARERTRLVRIPERWITALKEILKSRVSSSQNFVFEDFCGLVMFTNWGGFIMIITAKEEEGSVYVIRLTQMELEDLIKILESLSAPTGTLPMWFR